MTEPTPTSTTMLRDIFAAGLYVGAFVAALAGRDHSALLMLIGAVGLRPDA